MPDSPTPGTAAGDNPLPARRSFVLRGLLGGAIGLAVGGAGGYAAGSARRSATESQSDDPAAAEVEAEQRKHAATSYSQNGEDLVLRSWFNALGIGNPSYLDIGAAEPVGLSNTYLFYAQGARGVLVEPNVDLSDKIRRIRPGDKLVVAGIGISDQAEADYYVTTHPMANTFDKSQVEHMERVSDVRLVRAVKMPLVSINRVIQEQFGGATPDLVSIDIEGLDYAVLKTLDFSRFRPKVICVETVIFGTFDHNSDTPKLLAEKGYELRGQTYPNMIFIDKQLLKRDKK